MRYEIEVDIAIYDEVGNIVESQTLSDDLENYGGEHGVPTGFMGDFECLLDEMLDEIEPEPDFDEVQEKIQNALTEREYDFFIESVSKCRR